MKSLAVLVHAGPAPLVALLGGAFDPAAMPDHARVLAARSFVDACPSVEADGPATSAAVDLARELRADHDVRFLVARVADASGDARRDALGQALRWVRAVADDLGDDPGPLPPGLARTLAERGVLVVSLAAALPVAGRAYSSPS